MVFYKGAISYSDLQEIPIPEILQLHNNAMKIAEAMNKSTSK
jgi:hypothetical protein